MSENKDETPDWKKISDLTDDLDKVIDDGIIKKEMSFIEIDIALLMIREKLQQEKHRILNHIYKDDDLNDTPKSTPPEGFYR